MTPYQDMKAKGHGFVSLIFTKEEMALIDAASKGERRSRANFIKNVAMREATLLANVEESKPRFDYSDSEDDPDKIGY